MNELQEGVSLYNVNIHIETPLPEPEGFVPDGFDLAFDGLDRDTAGMMWKRYAWFRAQMPAQEVARLLDAYVIEEREIDGEVVIRSGRRIMQCLRFHGHYPGPFMNEAIIYADPILAGLAPDVLEQVAPLSPLQISQR